MPVSQGRYSVTGLPDFTNAQVALFTARRFARALVAHGLRADISVTVHRAEGSRVIARWRYNADRSKGYVGLHKVKLTGGE